MFQQEAQLEAQLVGSDNHHLMEQFLPCEEPNVPSIFCVSCHQPQSENNPLIPCPCDGCDPPSFYHPSCMENSRSRIPNAPTVANWTVIGVSALLSVGLWTRYDIRQIVHTDSTHNLLPYRKCSQCNGSIRLVLRADRRQISWWERIPMVRCWPLVVMVLMYFILVLACFGLHYFLSGLLPGVGFTSRTSREIVPLFAFTLLLATIMSSISILWPSETAKSGDSQEIGEGKEESGSSSTFWQTLIALLVYYIARYCYNYYRRWVSYVYSGMLARFYAPEGFDVSREYSSLGGQPRLLAMPRDQVDVGELTGQLNEELPVELIVVIFSYLSVPDLVHRVSPVCQYYYSLVLYPRLTLPLDLQNFDFCVYYSPHNWLWKVLYQRTFCLASAQDKAQLLKAIQHFQAVNEAFSKSISRDVVEEEMQLVSFRDAFVDQLEDLPCGICCGMITFRDRLLDPRRIMWRPPCSCDSTPYPIHRKCHSSLRRCYGEHHGFLSLVHDGRSFPPCSLTGQPFDPNAHDFPFSTCRDCGDRYGLVEVDEGNGSADNRTLVLVGVLMKLALFLACVCLVFVFGFVFVFTFINVPEDKSLVGRVVSRVPMGAMWIYSIHSALVFVLNALLRYYNDRMAQRWDVVAISEKDGGEEVAEMRVSENLAADWENV